MIRVTWTTDVFCGNRDSRPPYGTFDRCHRTLKTHLRRFLFCALAMEIGKRIAGDLQDRGTSLRRRGSERERWDCLDEGEIIASRVVVSSTTASPGGCWTIGFFSLPLSLFVFSWSTRALRTPPPRTYKSFTVWYFYSKSRLLDFSFGTSLFALQPESVDVVSVLSDRPAIMCLWTNVCRAFYSNKVRRERETT